jgi:hypothetical protein
MLHTMDSPSKVGQVEHHFRSAAQKEFFRYYYWGGAVLFITTAQSRFSR